MSLTIISIKIKGIIEAGLQIIINFVTILIYVEKQTLIN